MCECGSVDYSRQQRLYAFIVTESAVNESVLIFLGVDIDIQVCLGTSFIRHSQRVHFSAIARATTCVDKLGFMV